MSQYLISLEKRLEIINTINAIFGISERQTYVFRKSFVNRYPHKVMICDTHGELYLSDVHIRKNKQRGEYEHVQLLCKSCESKNKSRNKRSDENVISRIKKNLKIYGSEDFLET